jgi:hypothetical protein
MGDKQAVLFGSFHLTLVKEGLPVHGSEGLEAVEGSTSVVKWGTVAAAGGGSKGPSP